MYVYKIDLFTVWIIKCYKKKIPFTLKFSFCIDIFWEIIYKYALSKYNTELIRGQNKSNTEGEKSFM